MAAEHIVVLCTAPDASVAERIARALLEERLVACATVIPGATSFYRWKGDVSVDREVQMVMKTRAARFSEVAATVKRVHPHEVPELIALPLVAGSEAYLAWIDAETT